MLTPHFLVEYIALFTLPYHHHTGYRSGPSGSLIAVDIWTDLVVRKLLLCFEQRNVICWAMGCEVFKWTINYYYYHYYFQISHTGADYCSPHLLSYDIHLKLQNKILLYRQLFLSQIYFVFTLLFYLFDSIRHAQNSRSSIFLLALHRVVSLITHSRLDQSSSTSSPSDSSPAFLSYVLSLCLSWISFISSA